MSFILFLCFSFSLPQIFVVLLFCLAVHWPTLYETDQTWKNPSSLIEEIKWKCSQGEWKYFFSPFRPTFRLNHQVIVKFIHLKTTTEKTSTKSPFDIVCVQSFVDVYFDNGTKMMTNILEKKYIINDFGHKNAQKWAETWEQRIYDDELFPFIRHCQNIFTMRLLFVKPTNGQNKTIGTNIFCWLFLLPFVTICTRDQLPR